MRKIIHLLLLLCLLATFAGAALAQDDEPCAGELGAAHGLCNAYCEATECDCSYDPGCEPRASAVACKQIYDNYAATTGDPLTCGDVCPCLDVNGWPTGNETWVRLATGFFPNTCYVESGNQLTLRLPGISIGGERAIVTTNGNNSSCSLFVNVPSPTSDTFFVSLTAEEADLCRAVLLDQAAGVCPNP